MSDTMTVEEMLAKWHHTQESPRFKADLQRLLYTESTRAAGVARMQNNEEANDYRTKMFADATHVPTGKHLCDMIADEILRTSPGKVGAQ